MASVELIERFVSEVDWSLYEGAEYAFAAWRKGDQLVSLGCRITAVPHSPIGSAVDQLGQDELVVARGYLNKDELPSLLAGLPSGHIRLGDHALDLVGQGSTELGWWRNSSPEGARNKLGWPGEELLGHGANQAEIIGGERFEKLEREMLRLTNKSLAAPTSVGIFLGGAASPLDVIRRLNTEIAVYAPIYLRLQQPDLDLRSHQLTFQVECRFSTVPADVEIFVTGPSGPEPERVSAQGWDPSTDSVRSFSLLTQPLAGPREIHLFSFGQTIEVRRVGAPRLAAIAHAQLDPSDRWLTGMIGDGKKPTGDNFAQAVVSVLQLGGVPALYYGYSKKQLNHAPDIVAELGSHSLLVAECKSAAPAPEDVGTVRARADEIAAPLGGRWQIELLPVLFTPVPASALSHETLHAAHHQGVKIVSREKLLAFREAISRGESSLRALRELFGILAPL
jgi:hypothetical protein